MSPSQADILLHALSGPTRNHYVTSGEDADVSALVAAGLMAEVKTPAFLAAGDRVFMATDAGKIEATRERLRRRAAMPRLTVGQQRYRAWLRVSDLWDVSFGEFLRRGLYREVNP